MYAFISGKLIEATTEYVVIDNNGIGYMIYIPGGEHFAMPAIGTDVMLYTHFISNENGTTLYGFADKSDRSLFLKMLSVSGIGPKGALALLATIGAKGIISAILNDDEKAISKAPGIGAKTAKRLIIDLKDKIDIEQATLAVGEEVLAHTESIDSPAINDAIMALNALGYPYGQAKEAVMRVKDAQNYDVETLLSLALKEM